MVGGIGWVVAMVAGSWREFESGGWVEIVVLVLVLALLSETVAVLEGGFEVWRKVSELILFFFFFFPFVWVGS